MSILKEEDVIVGIRDLDGEMLNEGILTDFMAWARHKIKGATIKIFKLTRSAKKGLLSFRKGKATNILGINTKNNQLGVGLKIARGTGNGKNSFIIAYNPRYITGTTKNKATGIKSINTADIGKNPQTKQPSKKVVNSNGPFEPIPENKFFNSMAKQLFEYEEPEIKRAEARKNLQDVAMSTRNFEIPIKSNYKSPVIDVTDLPDIFETLLAMLSMRKTYKDPIPSFILFGESGSGKTAIANQFISKRESAGWQTKSFMTTTINYDALTGIPSLDTTEGEGIKDKKGNYTKQFKTYATDLFPTEDPSNPGSGGKWIFFFDEFNRDATKMEALMNIALDGSIGETKLPINSIVVMAGNTGASKDDKIAGVDGVMGDSLNVGEIGTDVWSRAKMVKYLAKDEVESSKWDAQNDRMVGQTTYKGPSKEEIQQLKSMGIDYDPKEWKNEIDLAVEKTGKSKKSNDAEYNSLGLEVKSDFGTEAGMGGAPAVLTAFRNMMAHESSTGKYALMLQQFNADHPEIQVNSRMFTNIGDTMASMAYKDWVKVGLDEKFDIPSWALKKLPKEAQTKAYYFQNFKKARSPWPSKAYKFPSPASYYLHMMSDYYLTRAASGMFGNKSEEVIDLITMNYESARNKFGKLDPGIVLFSVGPFIEKETGLAMDDDDMPAHPLDTYITNNSTAYEMLDDVVNMLGEFKDGKSFMSKAKSFSAKEGLEYNSELQSVAKAFASESMDDEPFKSLAAKSKLINATNLTGAVFAAFNLATFLQRNSHTGDNDGSGSEKASLAKLYDKLNKESNQVAEEQGINKVETLPWQIHLCMGAIFPDYAAAAGNSRKLVSDSVLTPLGKEIFSEALDLFKRMK